MNMKFKEGDLVWAKKMGCLLWPGRITKPKKLLEIHSKTPNSEYIYFFGSRNYAWVEEFNIKPYFVYKEKLTDASKAPCFQGAILEIEEFIRQRKINPNCKPLLEEHIKAQSELDETEDGEEGFMVMKSKKRSVMQTRTELDAKKLRLEFDKENSSEFVKNLAEHSYKLPALDNPRSVKQTRTEVDVNKLRLEFDKENSSEFVNRVQRNMAEHFNSPPALDNPRSVKQTRAEVDVNKLRLEFDKENSSEFVNRVQRNMAEHFNSPPALDTPIKPDCKPLLEEYIYAKPEFGEIDIVEEALAVMKSETEPIKQTRTEPDAKKLRLEFDKENSSKFVKNMAEHKNKPPALDNPDIPPADDTTSDYVIGDRPVKTSKLSFGFVGLGEMGSCIVNNLISTGHKINLWNRNLEKAEEVKKQVNKEQIETVEVCNTLCDVVKNSNIIFCCVLDPEASRDIVYGICGVLHQLNGSLEGKGYVEMTSIDPDTSKEICRRITSNGGRYLEAQIQFKISNKEANEVNNENPMVLAAGDRTLFVDCLSCFIAMRSNYYYLGEVGMAAKMMLILQTIKGIAHAGLAEGFAFANRSGLSTRNLFDIFELTCPALVEKATTIIKYGLPNAQISLQQIQKDLKLALELANSINQPLLMASMAKEIFKHPYRFGYAKSE